VTLEDIPQLDHPTSTRTTTTGLPATTTSTTELPRMLRLEGACDFLSFLNTATFLWEGNTASGAPFWKAMEQQYYIYFDPDCHGGANGAPRWIIDNDAPDPQRMQDLDADGDCMYHAHTDSTNTVRPPEHASWSMFCNHQWTTRQISFFEVTTTTTTTTTSTTTSTTSVTSTTTTSTTATSTTATSTTTTTTSSTTSSTGTTTITETSTSTATNTSTTITETSTSTATTTTATSSITSTTSRTATTVTTITPTSTTATTFRSQGDTAGTTVAIPSGTVDTSDRHASCSGFACPPGTAMRPNASEILCAGSLCGDEDNSTCCEEPSTATTVAAAFMETTTEAPSGDGSTAAPVVPVAQSLRLTGACSENAALEGSLFALQGTTASGAPYYKAETSGGAYYIYHDRACSGVDKGTPRWILNFNAPDPSLTQDLDGDGRCFYLARLDSQDHSRPPSRTAWRMHCGSTWRDVLIGLEAPSATTTPAAPSPHDSISALVLNGVCEKQKFLNGLVFTKEGNTAREAPFYKADGKGYYMYWDEHCDGLNTSNPRWIIDTHRPSVNRSADLDDDRKCHYLARFATSDSATPPLGSDWRVYCDHGWQDLHLDLQEAFARVPNGTCEAAGKVTISDAHACSLAASHLSLSQSAPVNVPSAHGPSGCFWDASSSRLQLVTSSPQAAHAAEHDHADSGNASEASSNGTHHGGHRRLSGPALEALCAGGQLAQSSGHQDAAVISAAVGLRAPAWALAAVALLALGLAVGV